MGGKRERGEMGRDCEGGKGCERGERERGYFDKIIGLVNITSL